MASFEPTQPPAMEQTMGYLKGDAQAMHPDSAAAMETLRQEQRRKKK